MKTALSLMAFILLVSPLGGASSGKTQAAKKSQSQLGTSFRFDGSSLHGKYQSSPSSVATVENDKFLEDLLGARKSFKDRLQEDKERN